MQAVTFNDIDYNRSNIMDCLDYKKLIKSVFETRGEGTGSEGDPLTYVACPWSKGHTHQSSTSTYVVFPKNSRPIFHCLHAHCQGQNLNDVLDLISIDKLKRFILKSKLDTIPTNEVNINEPEVASLPAELQSEVIINDCTIPVLEKKEEINPYLINPPVIPIAYYEQTGYFYSMDSKQMLNFQMTSKTVNLDMLCSDENYWEYFCPDAYQYDTKTGDIEYINKDIIVKKLIISLKNTGRNFTNYLTCENGVWLDNGRVVYMAGQKCFVDGKETPFYSVGLNNIYQSQGTCTIEQEPSTETSFKNMVGMFDKTSLSGNSGWILGSIICAGYLSGLSPWRSHCWITADSGAGKSELVKYLEILTHCISSISKSGTLTEAGIRQAIGHSATIFIHDECENTAHIDKELDLIRVSSTGGYVARGTQSGKQLNFLSKCTFILASVSDSLIKNTDKNRFIKLYMKNDLVKIKQWPELKKILDQHITKEFGARLCWRMMTRAKDFLAYHNLIKNQFLIKISNIDGYDSSSLSRISDLYSTVIAAYIVMTKDSYDEKEVDNRLQILLTQGYFEFCKKGGEESASISEGMFDYILDSIIVFKGGKFTVRQIINKNIGDNSTGDLYRELNAIGIYPFEKLGIIKFKNNSQYLTDIATKFGYANYKDILRKYPGAELPKNGRRSGVEVFKGVEVPYKFSVTDISKEDFTNFNEEVL